MVAVYLGDLWHANDRLTAAGDTTAPSIALGPGKLETCGQGLGLGAKMGGGFTQGCMLVTQRRILRKSNQGCEKWFLGWGKPHAGGYVLVQPEPRCSIKVTEFGYFL